MYSPSKLVPGPLNPLGVSPTMMTGGHAYMNGASAFSPTDHLRILSPTQKASQNMGVMYQPQQQPPVPVGVPPQQQQLTVGGVASHVTPILSPQPPIMPAFTDVTDQINWLKKELRNKELKLEECQLNIKTFWNPELKKERMARMSDNEKYQQLKDSYQKLAEESDRSAMVIQQLSEELQHQRQGFMEVSTSVLPETDNQITTLKIQLSQKDNESFLMKKTLEEMELRIETQKETLASRDQSIKKLLEIIQERGLANNVETNLDYSQTKLRNVELESQVSELNSRISAREKEVNDLKADLMYHLDTSTDAINQASSFGSSTTDATKLQSLRAVLENKEDNIRNLQRRLDFMEEELNKFRLGASAGLVDMNSFDSYSKFNEIQRDHVSFLKSKVDQLRSDCSQKETDLIATQTKLDILNKQNMDYSSHINVLRETLSAKEQQNKSLQTDLDAVRTRLQEKEAQLQKKTMYLDNVQLEKSSFEQELKAALERKERKISSLEQNISHLEDQIKDRDNRLQALATKKAVTPESQQMLVDTLEKTLGEKERQIESMKQLRDKEMVDKMEEVDLYSRISKELQTKNDELTNQMSDKETELADTNEKASSLMVSNMKKDSQIKVLNNSLMQKQDDLLDLEKKVRKLNEEKVTLIKEKQEMHKQIDALEEQVNHYIDELAKTQSQLDKLSEVLRRSEQEKQVHERRVNELESNLNKVKEKLTGIKRSKEDERMLNAQLLNDARKREGEVIHDVQEMQDIILEKDRRIGELEEALNETAKMTVAREAALDQHHHVTNHAQQKIEQLQLENEDLQKALNMSNKKLGDLAFQVTEKEGRVQQLQMDRRRQMEEVMQLKQEAILATINEKQANISLLETAGAQNPVVTRDLKKLHDDKQKLLRQLGDMNEKRVKMIHALEAKATGKKVSRNPGMEEDGIWA